MHLQTYAHTETRCNTKGSSEIYCFINVDLCWRKSKGTYRSFQWWSNCASQHCLYLSPWSVLCFLVICYFLDSYVVSTPYIVSSDLGFLLSFPSFSLLLSTFPPLWSGNSSVLSTCSWNVYLLALSEIGQFLEGIPPQLYSVVWQLFFLYIPCISAPGSGWMLSWLFCYPLQTINTPFSSSCLSFEVDFSDLSQLWYCSHSLMIEDLSYKFQFFSCWHS